MVWNRAECHERDVPEEEKDVNRQGRCRESGGSCVRVSAQGARSRMNVVEGEI